MNKIMNELRISHLRFLFSSISLSTASDPTKFKKNVKYRNLYVFLNWTISQDQGHKQGA